MTSCDLDFRGRGAKFDNENDITEIIEFFDSNSAVSKLIMSGNSLGVGAAKILSRKLSNQNEIKILILSDLFTGRLKSEIPVALDFIFNGITTSGAQITELDLSDNAFGPAGIIALKPFFNHDASNTLKILKFNNNGMGIDGGKVLSSYLINCHKRCLSKGKIFALKEFYAGRNRLENPGSIALADAFRVINTLEVISIPQNGIYHEGISALSQAFSFNPHLKIINLNDNTATHIGAASLSRAIVTLKELESLNLGDCLLKDSGAFHIAKAFNQIELTCLKELELNNNEISIKGALEIVDSLAESTIDANELIVNLNGNCFGTEGLDILKERIDDLKQQRIDINFTFSEDEGTPDEASEEEESPYEHISREDDYGDEISDGGGSGYSSGDEKGDSENDIVVVGKEDDEVLDNDVLAQIENLISEGLNLKNVEDVDITPTKSNTSANLLPFNFTHSFNNNNLIMTPPFQFSMDNLKQIHQEQKPTPNLFQGFPNFSFPPAKLETKSTDMFNNLANKHQEPSNSSFNNISFNFKSFNLQDAVKGPQEDQLPQIESKKAKELLDNIFMDLNDVQLSLLDIKQLKRYLNCQNNSPDVLDDYIKTKEEVDCETFSKSYTHLVIMENNCKDGQLLANTILDSLLKFPAKYNDNELISALLFHAGLMKSENRKAKRPSLDYQLAVRESLKNIIGKPNTRPGINQMLTTFLFNHV